MKQVGGTMSGTVTGLFTVLFGRIKFKMVELFAATMV